MESAAADNTVMRNIRLRLAYDGTNYCGWQFQPNGPSIQAAVEEAILRLTGEAAQVVAAGRTDAGVHAVGQVAHFRTHSKIVCSKLRSGLQTFLPKEIVVVEVEDAPEYFHSRYGATRKRYRYVIDNSRVTFPFMRKYAYQVREELDAAAMHVAGQVLVGTHDFRSFESNWPNRPTSVRTVEEVVVTRHAGWPVWFQTGHLTAGVSPAESFISLDITADGFLYNMVRSIMGTLLEVGRGKWKTADVERILLGLDRAHAGVTVPPHGLYLVQVDYDGGGTANPDQLLERGDSE